MVGIELLTIRIELTNPGEWRGRRGAGGHGGFSLEPKHGGQGGDGSDISVHSQRSVGERVGKSVFGIVQ